MSYFYPQGIELSDEQAQAVETLLAFPKAVQTLGGYAGTGKTTTIKALSAHLPGFAVLAYTGKAASVLRRKGVGAATIHSFIYYPREVETVDAEGQLVKKVEWVLKDEAQIGATGFIVDEASMVPETLHKDLLSFGRPIIYVGDHGQLEPVGDARFALMKKPDVTLEKIHRNAGEIARFAEHVRRGGSPGAWKCKPGGAVVLKLKPGPDAELLRTDQVLVAYNSTRVKLCMRLRKLLGLPDRELVVGDRLICLQNDRQSGLFNGLQGTITALHRGERLTFTANGRDFRVRYDPATFLAEKPVITHGGGRIAFAFAHAITCHKAQGDEWPNVLVMEERLPKTDHRRWAYTAASRARERLVWMLG